MDLHWWSSSFLHWLQGCFLHIGSALGWAYFKAVETLHARLPWTSMLCSTVVSHFCCWNQFKHPSASRVFSETIGYEEVHYYCCCCCCLVVVGAVLFLWLCLEVNRHRLSADIRVDHLKDGMQQSLETAVTNTLLEGITSWTMVRASWVVLLIAIVIFYVNHHVLRCNVKLDVLQTSGDITHTIKSTIAPNL